MYIIAITGGIACGKSYICSIFSKQGFKLINADAVALKISQNNSDVLKALYNEFGASCFNADNSLNRPALASVVFADKQKLQKLNSIMHPAIFKDIQHSLNMLEQGGERIAVVEIPLLFESDISINFNCIICCYTTRQIQIIRLKQRCGISKEEAEQRIDSQMSLYKKMQMSHYNINTSHSFKHTDNQVKSVINSIMANIIKG